MAELRFAIAIVGTVVSLVFGIATGTAWGNNLVADIICSLVLVLVFMWVVWAINTLLYRFENGVEKFIHRYRSLRKPNKPYEKNSEDPFESATIPEALSGLTEFDRGQTSPDEEAEQSKREEYWRLHGVKH